MKEEGIEKYQQFLTLKHEWEKLNCFTIIEHLYKKFLDIDFSDTWQRIGKGEETLSKRWFVAHAEEIRQELKHWKKVDVTELKEYDIAYFTNKRNVPKHFAMYIGQNLFIHLPSNAPCSILFFNESYRDALLYPDTDSGVYRHESLV